MRYMRPFSKVVASAGLVLAVGGSSLASANCDDDLNFDYRPVGVADLNGDGQKELISSRSGSLYFMPLTSSSGPNIYFGPIVSGLEGDECDRKFSFIDIDSDGILDVFYSLSDKRSYFHRGLGSFKFE